VTAGERLERCFWCGKRDRPTSEWEQESLYDGWKRLCTRCATRRLNNPWNALLSMRKVEAISRSAPGTPLEDADSVRDPG
jgi:hypothetical protein